MPTATSVLYEKHSKEDFAKRGKGTTLNWNLNHFRPTDFNEETEFPSINEGVLIDEHLHVKLQCNGVPIPLPKWFTAVVSVKLNRLSMLAIFPQMLQTMQAHTLLSS